MPALALDAFLATWRGSAGNERANFQSFLRDFCAVLDLPMPVPEPKRPTLKSTLRPYALKVSWTESGLLPLNTRNLSGY